MISHTKALFFCICVSLRAVFQSDSEQMFIRERLYLLLLFNLHPRAVTECTLGLQAKNDGGCV